MLQLTGTSDLVQVVTDAVADIEVHASWAENNAGTITPGRTNTASITTATTTTVVGSPTSGRQYRVTVLNLRNNHGSTACNVTVQHTDGTSTETLIKVNLLAGESLTMDKNGVWHHYDTNGAEYPPSLGFASKTEMETGTSLVKVVSPGRQHYHPGHVKFWADVELVNAVPVLKDGYNVTSITDSGAGLATMTIATDFNNTNYAIQAQIQRTATTLTVTNLKYCNVRNATQAAGSFLVEVYDGTATTHVQEDVLAWYAFALGDAAA